MSESLRNDGRVWVPKKRGRRRAARRDPRGRARLLPRAQVPELRQPRPARHRLPRRQEVCDEGRGVGPAGAASTSTSPTPSSASARTTIRERYGNLFEMYEKITGEDPYEVPMRIYPAVHYTMGGLWVDYNLMSTSPACSCSARRTSPTTARTASAPSALMQGLADGYFVIPYTIGNYLAGAKPARSTTDHPEFKQAEADVAARSRSCSRIKGKRPSTASTASSASSCGTTAAWPQRRRASRRP
jgi:succinate dehydrogenase / fumarate reductase flavoprotein subunit